MTDYIQSILTGLFVGIGTGFANYFHDRHISKKLDKLGERFKQP